MGKDTIPVTNTSYTINHLLVDETETIDLYYDLLEYSDLTKEDRDKVIEIIADEKNHQLMLQAMVRNYDGGIKASEDGRKEAIDGLTNGEEKMPKIRKDFDDEDDEEGFEVFFLDGLNDGKGKKHGRA